MNNGCRWRPLPLAVSVGASQDGKTEPLDTSQTGDA
jgi:hypothetical protein